MLTKRTRESSCSSARFHTREVLTSTPITPLRTRTTPSTTRSAAYVSAWKPASPGVSTRLILRSFHSRWQSEPERDMPPPLLVLVPVRDRRPLLDAAEPVRLLGFEEQRLDERRLPDTAVSGDGDVANLRRLGGRHAGRVLLGRFEPHRIAAFRGGLLLHRGRRAGRGDVRLEPEDRLRVELGD